MRTLTVLLAAGVFACSIGRASAAGPTFSDKICPEATQYVIAVGNTRADESPQKIYDVTQAAVDAYSRCSKDKLSNGFREAQHYADTRGGQFTVLAVRALIALNRRDDAKRELLEHRPLVQQVVDWKTETVAGSQNHSPGTRGEGGGSTDLNAIGSDNRPSMYRDSAKDVVAAMDALLATLNASPAPAASPSH